jgi:hypothetical protein
MTFTFSFTFFMMLKMNLEDFNWNLNWYLGLKSFKSRIYFVLWDGLKSGCQEVSQKVDDQNWKCRGIIFRSRPQHDRTHEGWLSITHSLRRHISRVWHSLCSLQAHSNSTHRPPLFGYRPSWYDCPRSNQRSFEKSPYSLQSDPTMES